MSATVTDATRQAGTSGEPAAGQRDPSASDSAFASSGLIPVRGPRAELVDLGVLAALCALGLFGFGTAYGGSRYFIAGIVGLALGLGVAWWGARSRQPLIVVVAAAALTFFVFGGAVAVPSSAAAGFLPSPGAVTALVDGAIQGWARLLTMNPPVGDTAHLLVIPYLCGLVAGVLSLSIALRTRRPSLALLAPIGVLILSILFGTMRPASLLLQGTVFGALALWWIAHLQRSRRQVDAGLRRSRRWVGALAMVACAGLVATFAWRLMPGAMSNPRVILRAEPDFDPAAYPSPLIEYRHYTNGENEEGWQATPAEVAAAASPPVGDVADPGGSDPQETARDGWRATSLFEVSGLPADQRLRLATLDAYDRVVYSVGRGPHSSGYFQRVGETLPEPTTGSRPDGRTNDVTIEVLDGGREGSYQDIWMPVPDNATDIRFDGAPARATELGESLLWNSSTGTAALPVRLAAGDTYTVSSVRSSPPRRKDYAEATAAKVTTSAQQVQAVSDAARSLSEHWGCDPSSVAGGPGGAPEPTTETPIEPASVYDKILLIAQGLRVCGGLSDGASQSGMPSYPGHSDRRLTDMVGEQSAGMLGNGEQFAPLAALLSQASGVPARVVMGFRSPAESDRWRTEHGLAPNGRTYVVRGSDVAAWIEVALDRGDGVEWVPVLDVTPTKPVPQLRPQPKPLDPDSDPPPPPPSIPPSEEEAERDTCLTRTASKVSAASESGSNGAATESTTDTTGDAASNGSDCGSPPPECEADPTKCPAFPWWVLKVAGGLALPFILIGAVTAAIGGLKAQRRNRRRTRGRPGDRVNGGWLEVTDLASDMGAPVPLRVTRREAGAFIDRPEAERLAKQADSLVFGPGEPSDDHASRYWNQVDATCSAMLSDLSRFGRWKVLVSLSSLRTSGRRHLDRSRVRRSIPVRPTELPDGADSPTHRIGEPGPPHDPEPTRSS